jgi:hypothetical protein
MFSLVGQKDVAHCAAPGARRAVARHPHAKAWFMSVDGLGDPFCGLR